MKKNIWFLISLSVVLGSCQDPNPASKAPKNQRTVYFKNGKIEKQYTVDRNGKLHGESVDNSFDGKSKRKTTFFHGREIQYVSYWNGKLYHSFSRIIDSEHSEINSIIYFDSSGRIILEKSKYANIRYGDSGKKSLIIELPNFYKDSVNVFFYKSLSGFDNMVYNDGSKQVHRVVHFDGMDKVSIKLDLHDDDYFNGKLNLLIRGYKGKHRYEDGIHFMPQIKDMFVQLSKGEEPAKYNIDPIFAW